MSALDLAHPALPAFGSLPPLSRALMVIVQWDLRRRTRKDLRGMSDHMLRDIGLDPFLAAAEADKPFWRA